MNWSELHEESETLATRAHERLRSGAIPQAMDLFALSAQAEVKALDALGNDKPRTLGITAVSAAALWYKAGNLDRAEQLAHQASAMRAMPLFARAELRELLQTIWNERAQQDAGVSF